MPHGHAMLGDDAEVGVLRPGTVRAAVPDPAAVRRRHPDEPRVALAMAAMPPINYSEPAAPNGHASTTNATARAHQSALAAGPADRDPRRVGSTSSCSGRC